MNDVGQLLANFNKMTDDQHDMYPGSPESHLSDISFPSHVSGLESFVDMEDTLNNATDDHDYGDDIHLYQT